MVKGFQLVDLGQVTVDGAPASMELLELGRLCVGGLGVLEGLEECNTIRRQLAGFLIFIIEEFPDILHGLHPLYVRLDFLGHTFPDGSSLF